MESTPPPFQLRAQFTKTKTAHTVFMTDEAARHIEDWLKYKYRPRRKIHQT
jgi:hypothetical protein